MKPSSLVFAFALAIGLILFAAFTLAANVAIVLFFGISLLSPAPRLDPDIEAVMDV